jgi:small subunit ribosomal protein S3
MGQKVSPIGFRTGITRGWQSTWFAPKANYGDFLVEDQKIREYVDKKYNRQMPKGAVAKVEIIRTRNEVQVVLHSARPGIVIGPRGGEVDRFREELEEITGHKISVNVVEIKEPDLNACLVGEAIAEQLCKRASFRRTMKQYCELVMNAGAKGVKIICKGRLAGSEMGRCETQKMGSIPLHTLDANVDYAVATARTTYGAVGVKVWIYKGKFGEEIEPRPTRRRRAPVRRRRSARQGGVAGAKPAEAAATQDEANTAGAEAAAPPEQGSQEKPNSKEEKTE